MIKQLWFMSKKYLKDPTLWILSILTGYFGWFFFRSSILVANKDPHIVLAVGQIFTWFIMFLGMLILYVSLKEWKA